jgi:purine-cytosine permease-like protein
MNILRLPVVGSFLRWRYARPALQLLLLLISLAVVLHGLFGPQLAPRNLATVLTSIGVASSSWPSWLSAICSAPAAQWCSPAT